jgi:hypothetical protein
MVSRGESEQQHDPHHADPDRKRQQRGKRSPDGPGQHEHRREQQEIEQRAVAAGERVTGRFGPDDRQVRPGHVQRERAECELARP